MREARVKIPPHHLITPSPHLLAACLRLEAENVCCLVWAWECGSFFFSGLASDCIRLDEFCHKPFAEQPPHRMSIVLFAQLSHNR